MKIYVTRHELKQKQTSKLLKQKQFMDSHNFSFTIDPKTNKPEIKVMKKNENSPIE